jgi:hypothetical protein
MQYSATNKAASEIEGGDRVIFVMDDVTGGQS